MRKLVIIAMLATLAATPALAVDLGGRTFYAQAQATFPMGDWSDFVSLGYGAGLGVRFPHSESLSIALEASYLGFASEDLEGVDVSWSMIPVLLIAQHHLAGSSAYLLGGAGVAIASADVDFAESDIFDFDESSTEFAVALGAGIDATPKMFFEGRFNAISDANQLSLHMGLRF